ncbi:MAG: hypothetical protein DRI69_02990 [Bacteroidetes bacterium]|nr:MAG: hypothetical protein DRI69_02990 [Bacteroidota bacterium]
MRILNKLWVVALVLVLSASCGDLFELDLQDNPNEVTLDQAGPDFVYNSVQLAAIDTWQSFHFISDGLVRYTTTAAFTYTEALPATTGNGAWNSAYAQMFPDVQALNAAYAENPSLEVYAHTANILQAYIMMGLVDFFGDIPWRDALQGTNVISPTVDLGQEVYTVADELLTAAITALENTTASSPTNDLFYGGDVTKWVTCAKTLQLRIGATTRLIGGAAKMKAIIDAGDFIDDPSEDFQFAASTERDDPDSRHPFYPNHYESDDGTYMGNYFMWLMCCEKDTIEDPRIRHYFYRQVRETRTQVVNAYSCIHSDLPDPEQTPQWYLDVDPNMPYCVASDEYYGRDHGNGAGIPPDGPIRTVYGLFPGGGKWDNQSFSGVQNQGVDGALGEGIAPLVTSYMVSFYRAEAALTAGTGEDAKAMLEEGVRGSIDKVRSFEGRIPPAELNYVYATDVDGNPLEANLFIPSDEDVDAYIAAVLNRYDAAGSDNDKLDVVMKEFYIACAGNAYEVYNFYRRTGMPLNIQPGIDLSIGDFPRSILYASDNVNLNSSVEQKDLSKLIFWDDGSAVLR